MEIANSIQKIKNEFSFHKAFVMERINLKNQTFYMIDQNISSLKLLKDSCICLDPQSCFFMNLFNYYQDLPINDSTGKNIIYYSYSQAFTTYGLKCLERAGFIKIYDIEKEKKCNILGDYKSIIDKDFKVNEKYVKNMYAVQFSKKYSFLDEDVLFIKELAKIFHVDFTNFCFTKKNGKLYLALKKEFIMHQILSGETLKNMYKQKDKIKLILYDLQDYLLDLKAEKEAEKLK